MESKQAKGNLPELKKYKFLAENEFDLKRRRMSVLVANKNEINLIVKGSAESIIR
jgi:magnesium-transporting ATPase (P-type)